MFLSAFDSTLRIVTAICVLSVPLHRTRGFANEAETSTSMPSWLAGRRVNSQTYIEGMTD